MDDILVALRAIVALGAVLGLLLLGVVVAAWWLGVARHDLQRLTASQGLEARLEQAGWGIDFRAWRPSTDGAPALPLRIDARRGDAGVRLVVDAWSEARP